MWIRTQDKKELINTEHIAVEKKRICSQHTTLGEYESEQRAIEVLDEIQKELFHGIKLDYITSGGVRHYRDKIFEMPTE
ncbi:hypothetical protein [Romboutsia sp. 1001285H_161024_C4]|uniref:hypothetical protein n=1 Tax=Romboutsia sp. 1001285H_161024_C4 TaxID=2787109 RepID=UPI00189746A2|nr:hypothetical protein [Romboutsia sp. 1001285H_161024_C4]